MSLVMFTCGVVSTPQGSIPAAYLGIVPLHDTFTIALLNTRFPADIGAATYKTHLFTGSEKQRNARKQAKRVFIYGSGMISAATLTVKADGQRFNTYAFDAASPAGAEGILWEQGLIPLIGRTFEITLQVAGNSIEVNEMELSYVTYG